ncbi:hypothetical protein GLOIN_2v1786477 [Rhizophagus irregularis DAOM 181602=DAOM 197198]|nr:hypothetical protein GLOIN_2v1786477 [Rhizophagus irregularis DAOM 181602=DAOM 197198]
MKKRRFRLQIPGDIDVNYSFLPRRRVRYTSHPMPQSTSLNIESDVYNTSEQNTEMSLGSESNNESYNEIFEDYSPPPYQANMDAEENPIDDKFSWILLWIMNYRITYNIPETATESLIKFMKIVLNEIGGENFRTFPDSLYLAKKVADLHLGLMLNVDWFQPFDGTNHSTGAIYAVICNLPHNIRFKRENLLLLGMLPGPNEVSLHKINHYLAPIVNELTSLWEGIILNRTYEHQLGKKICAALIMVSCDIPAARKICGHVSALVSCHRCQKKANYENHQHNFAGMGDMEDWFVARDSNEHLQNALGWRRCNSDASRKRFVKQTGVRWSELLRLPYFDPIRFTIVDPMHYLFLGIAKWIVKRIWVDQGILTSSMLNEVQKQMNRFQVPVDLGRIPGKIDCREGFSNFTADQCPLYAFWCFSFERMNGILGSLPNSNRKIEPELMRRLMNDNRIRDIITSSVQMKGLELLENHPTVGSLSENDQFASDEMERFWLNSKNIQESTVTGCEAFPGEMLRPTSENVVLSQLMLDLMIDYYIATYEMYNFRKPSDAIEQDAITIRVKMDKFGRCRIGSEVFGSALSFRHIKSSYVLAKFITTDGEVDRYPGQVQYYFKHEIDLPNGPTEHYLAFIRWYRPANTANIRYHFSIDDTEETETCNVELWKTDFFPESRDCIIPVHNILCRFVPAKYKISSNRNATEYLVINPLNRKFHIR